MYHRLDLKNVEMNCITEKRDYLKVIFVVTYSEWDTVLFVKDVYFPKSFKLTLTILKHKVFMARSKMDF